MDTVETWWPNGYGNQTLYDLTASFTSADIEDDISTKSVNIGFRTVELDQSFVDTDDPSSGRFYRIKVNNIYMFMRGSNWIPAHILPELVTPEYTRELLTAARDTHQNCMRVWGGGIYETDEFYNIADELGILMWQDMMFACSMYPVDDNFLNTTLKETRLQAERLQHHPSVLLWSANNENEAALKDNWYGTASNYDQYKEDYVKLYVDTITTTLRSFDPSRNTIVSSPSNGLASEEAGYIADDPYDARYGDVHYYNYDDNAWNYEQYPATRFASEYGFQSFPSYQSLVPVFSAEDFSINSAMMSHRQHHPGGNTELGLQLKAHFVYDENTTSFTDYLYLCQLHQAMAIKTETEFYRRMRSTLNADGTGYTMGSLYWQLNDVWQGASWASIEFEDVGKYFRITRELLQPLATFLARRRKVEIDSCE
ncbi:UNVERIFIED_CONTAM: hypothetical protein GTU68_031341 [Idotea baltica]|nr:hypothetical protein [Idotea baltica]MCL4132950.1 hypothetical protein [Idotea baltica]MCL4132951.1 hypothetical protein [Idotea baltica]